MSISINNTLTVALNGMITVLFAKFAMNDMPHRAGLVAYGQERSIERKVDIETAREEGLGLSERMMTETKAFLRIPAKREAITAYLCRYSGLEGEDSSTTTLERVSARMGVSQYKARSLIESTRGYILRQWRILRFERLHGISAQDFITEHADELLSFVKGLEEKVG